MSSTIIIRKLRNPSDQSGRRLVLTSASIGRDGNVSGDVGAHVENSSSSDVTPSWADGELCPGLFIGPPPAPMFAVL